MTTATATVPPATSSAPLSWDDQIVPALRRKLEAESSQLGKRISVLDSSQGMNGVGGSTNGASSASTGWGPLGSEQRVSSNRSKGSYRGPAPSSSSSSSIYATPTRNASQKMRIVAAGESPQETTQRAREKARAIRERKASVRRNDLQEHSSGTLAQGSSSGSGTLYHSSSSTQLQDRENGDTSGDYHHPSSSSSGSVPLRLRTQSTPMKYVEASPRKQQQAATPREKAHIRAEEANRRDREEMEQSEWSGAAQDNTRSHLEPSQGPRLPSSIPSNYTRTMRSGSVDPSALTSSGATTDPLFSANRNTRAATEPPEVLSTNNDWDEVLPPAIARRVAQEELLRQDPSLRSVEGLIDTWDRQGLPLTQGQVMELVGRRRDREREEQRQRDASIVAGETELQESSVSADDSERPTIVPPPPPVGLSAMRGGSRSSAASRPAQSRPQEYEMQSRVEAQAQVVPQTQAHTATTTQQHPPQSKPGDREAEGAGCCACVVM